MLPKSRRIPKTEFSSTPVPLRRYSSPHFGLSVAKNKANSEPSKISFSLSKKVCKNASDRNKLRRRGYALVGKILNNISSGYLLFFSFKKGAEKLKITDLEKEISELLYSSSVLS